MVRVAMDYVLTDNGAGSRGITRNVRIVFADIEQTSSSSTSFFSPFFANKNTHFAIQIKKNENDLRDI